jgi:hypothetical protein
MGLKSSQATDDPPRNVCEEHQLCLFPSCLKYASEEDPFCEQHKNVRCKAFTKRKRPCKSDSISPYVPYCRDHLHFASTAPSSSENDVFGDIDDEVQHIRKTTASPHPTKCVATTRKGKPCKGTRMEGSEYCYDHSFQSSQFVYSGAALALPASTGALAQKKDNVGGESKKLQSLLNRSEGVHMQSSNPNIGSSDVTIRGADAASVGSSANSAGDAIVDSTLDLDLDELSFDEGANMQHLVEVFEVGGGDTDDESLQSEFFDALDYSSTGNSDADDLRRTDSKTWAWKMTLDERWEEIHLLMREEKALLNKALSVTKAAISSARKDLKKASVRSKSRIYENRSVIGGTMVGCISRLDSIRSARPFAVVIEEASEVLEPLLLSCLCESTMKLEMIGDHRQLQPSVMSRFDFEILNKINISMFQRLIEAPPGHEVPSTVLSVQRRMRKSICDLTRQYYSDVVKI